MKTMIKKSKSKSERKSDYQIRKAKQWRKDTLSYNKKLIEDAKAIPIRNFNRSPNGKVHDEIIYKIKVLMYKLAKIGPKKGKTKFLQKCENRLDSCYDTYNPLTDESLKSVYIQLLKEYNNIIRI
jgi:hypothetical protein